MQEKPMEFCMGVANEIKEEVVNRGHLRLNATNLAKKLLVFNKETKAMALNEREV